MPIVAGTRISREQTLELAATLARDGSDRTARVLVDAITLARDFVALTTDDREAILAVLKHPRDQLVDLRTALFAELTGVEASFAIRNLKAGRHTRDEHRGKPNARSRSDSSRRGTARGAGDAPGHGEAEQPCDPRPKAT